MKDFWLQQARRIDALTLRERAIMFASLAFALVAMADTLALSPQLAEQKVQAAQLQRESAALDVLRARLPSPGAGQTAQQRLLGQLAQTQAEQRQVDAEIQRQLAGGNAGTRLDALLTRVLTRHQGLTLLKLATLAPQSRPAPALLPTQGVEIAVRGNYADLVRYVGDTEEALPALHWGALKVSRSGDDSTLEAKVFLAGPP